MQLKNTEHTFSFYKNLHSAQEPDNEFDINQLIEVIRYGYIKKDIKILRSVEDIKERNKIKSSKLPCVTLSGTFEKRNKDNLKEHSGLIQIDIDKIEEFESKFTSLTSDPYTFVAFKSPSGNGIKLIVKINPSIETHLEQFHSLEKYYLDEYNIKIDSACKDIARCMLLSYDPNIYCNPFSEVYAELLVPEIKVAPRKQHNINYKIDVNSTDTTDIIENLTSEIERNNIDITNGYENWIRIGFSLATSLGESGGDYFHRLSKFNEGYRTHECDKQFANLLKMNNGSITLGTLIYIARSNGVEVIFPSHKNKKPTLSISDNLEIDKPSLYEALKSKRLELANKIKKPAFTVFTNKTLDDLVEKLPKTEEELLDIHGIGQNKCDVYANDILPIILNFHGNDSANKKSLVQKYVIPKLKNHEESLFKELKAFRLDYALERGLKAFHVFGNTTLYEIVSSKPKTKAELLDVKGIGDRKLEQISDRVLEIIRKHAS